MFLIFGFRTRDKIVSQHPRVCEVCGVHATQTLVKRSTRFSLFFIPLFPVKPSTYYLECGNCGTARRADRRAVSRLAA